MSHWLIEPIMGGQRVHRIMCCLLHICSDRDNTHQKSGGRKLVTGEEVGDLSENNGFPSLH